MFNKYMSPELIEVLKNEYNLYIINLEKTNIFSIGIILI